MAGENATHGRCPTEFLLLWKNEQLWLEETPFLYATYADGLRRKRASVAFLVTLKASSTDAVYLPSPFWTGSKTDPNGREFQWFALPLALGPRSSEQHSCKKHT